MRTSLSIVVPGVVLGFALLSPGCKHGPQATAASMDMATRSEAVEPTTEATAAPGAEAPAAPAAEAVADEPVSISGAAPVIRPAPPAEPAPVKSEKARRSRDDGAAGAVGLATGASMPAARDAIAAAPAAQMNVRAGEWDDNANYRDYVRWLEQASRGVARLDVAQRHFLVVEDADGKPVPNCAIELTAGQHRARLVTPASGRALLFPHALGFGRAEILATPTCGQATAAATIHTDQTDEVTVLKLATARELPARRTIDLAFVLDTTGSMAEEIEAVKSTVRTVAARLGAAQTDVRIGLVEYRDRSDSEVTHTYPFSSDLAAFSRSVAALHAEGGGDMPEDMQAGLSTALDRLAWRSDAALRMMVVIADAPPHLDYQDERDYADAARRAAARGIKLFTVSASGMNDVGQIVMRQMAQFTGGSNLFVLRGGAGPQSVGGGDPKSSCGGTHEQYASGNLDQLLLAKVRRELASIDGDPLQIAGRDQDENAKPCDQRLVIAN